MDDFVTRYANKTTKKGHVVKVDVTETSASLWYLHWGEYKGVNDHHHFGIARITNFGDRYRVEWFEGTNTVPVSIDSFSAIDDVHLAIKNCLDRR